MELVEEGGTSLDGGTAGEGTQATTTPNSDLVAHVSDPIVSLTVDNITVNASRDTLVKCTAEDPTLETIRNLADSEDNGYV